MGRKYAPNKYIPLKQTVTFIEIKEDEFEPKFIVSNEGKSVAVDEDTLAQVFELLGLT
jgi:hypothetical protein